MFNKFRMMVVGVAFLGLSACASLTPVENALIFDLVPVDETLLKGRPVGFSLSVSEPKASNVLDSEKVLVRPTPVLIQYYSDIIWSDRIPKLIQRRVIQAFEDSKRLRSVGARADGFDSQYDLVLEIRDFQIEPSLLVNKTANKPLRVKVVVFAKLISERSAKVVRSTRITKIVEIKTETRENIALAFNDAFKQMSVDLVKWTLR